MPKKNIFSISVMVVDDHEVVLRGICALLEGTPNIKIVGTAGNGQEAVKLARALKPNILLMDINMPKMDGIQAAKIITKKNKKIKIIMLSSIDRSETIIRSKEAGARGYVIKALDSSEIIEAIDRVFYDREKFVYRGYHVSSPTKSSAINAALFSQLTDKENEVLKLMLNDYSVSDMVKLLKIEERSIRVRKYKIKLKLGVENDEQLITLAIQAGFHYLA